MKQNDLESGSQPLIDDYVPEMRRGFIRKVYGILGIQLLFSSIVCATAIYTPSFQPFFMNTNVFAVSLVTTFATICGIGCYAHKYPWNLLLLGIFTAAESIILSRICLIFSLQGNLNLVLISLGITASIFLILTAVACFSKKDFSFMENILFIGLITFLGFSILEIFIQSAIFHIVIAWCGVMLFSGYVLYDTSAILTRLGPDDAITASLMLYLDILNIFMLVLEILRFNHD